MKRRIIATVLLVLGMLTAGGTAAFADPPGMTHDSACETADCMTYD